MAIKVVALDIYGTVLATDDADNEMPPRKGTKALFRKCARRGAKVVGASDADTETVRLDLEASQVDTGGFDAFYRLDQLPCKDFSGVIRDYGIEPSQLLVIGDSYKDVQGAMDCGACYIRVPEYRGLMDDFDLGKIRF